MLDIGANFSALPQVYLAALFVILIYKKKTQVVILASLFFYSAFYFLHDYVSGIIGLEGLSSNRGGSPILGTISGFFIITFCFLKFFQFKRDGASGFLGESCLFFKISIFLICCVAISFVFAQISRWSDGRAVDILSLKIGVISIVSWIAVILIGSNAAQIVFTNVLAKENQIELNFFVSGAIYILALTLIAAFIEVATGKSFFGDTNILPNHIVFRTGAFLMNPNGWAAWEAILGGIAAFLYHRGLLKLSSLVIVSGLIAASFSLTGARSVFYAYSLMLLLGSLCVFVLINRCRNLIFCFTPISLLFVWLFAFSSLGNIAHKFLGICNNITSSVLWNTTRIITAPYDLMQYVLFRAGIPKGADHLIDGSVAVGATRLSIEGRVVLPNISHAGEGLYGSLDNAFLPMLDVAGASGFIAWCVLWLSMVSFAAFIAWKRRSIASIYGLSAVVGFVLLGMSMRVTQLFPVWALFSFVTGLSLQIFTDPCSDADAGHR